MSVTTIHGAIVSCADLDAQIRIFNGVYRLEVVAQQSLDLAAVNALWGVDGRTAVTILLETPDTQFGVRLIHFNPISDLNVRDLTAGMNANFLRVIDFYTPDFDAGRARVAQLGFKLSEDIAEYVMPGGTFIEAQLWGPDDVVTVLVGGSKDFLKGFATITDRLFSEVMSISFSTADVEQVRDFYQTVFGLGVVYEFTIEDDSFSDLMQTEETSQVRGTNIGTRSTEPYFGIIDLGLPRVTDQSLLDWALLPNLGLNGATLFVPSVDEVMAAATLFGSRILAPVTTVNLAPYGPVKSLTLFAPHGVVHHVIERMN